MKLYISGGINGIKDAREAFSTAASVLSMHGLQAVNPFDVQPCADSSCLATDPGTGDGSHSWECYLRNDLIEMLRCDGVATIKGWEHSRGARLEVSTAIQVGMPVKTLEEWVRPLVLVLPGASLHDTSVPERLPTTKCRPTMHDLEGACYWCCDRCNLDQHRCPGCGDPLRHNGTEKHTGLPHTGCML